VRSGMDWMHPRPFLPAWGPAGALSGPLDLWTSAPLAFQE